MTSSHDILGTCMACLGRYGARIEPCGFCADRAALEARADRAAQAWRIHIPNSRDLGELLADFAEAELRLAQEEVRSGNYEKRIERNQ